MEALQAILSRRSVRKYTDRPVDSDTITALLKAAMAAPSAGNQQSWRFIVVQDRTTLQKVPEVHPYSSMVPHAQAAVVICGETAEEKHPGYWVQDCAAATQNFLLAAHALGLGAVWLGVYPRQDRAEGLRRLLDIPDSIVPLSMVPLGYPAEQKPPSDRYDETKVHHERW